MKRLKFDHDQAELILRGDKTSTWRLFDDKNLAVNDDVVLIDKVEPENPATWKAIGVGRLNSIIEKRLGDIGPDDYRGHEPHGSAEARLATYRRRYGDGVTDDTPIRMIQFSFTPGAPDSAGAAHATGQTSGDNHTKAYGAVDDVADVKAARAANEHVILYADGGSRGNPGHSACGYVIMNEAGEVLVDKGVYLGITTNNQAEYQGLKSGLEEARRMGAREVAVRLDSLLVINQMKGIYKVKNRDLWPIHDAVKVLAAGFHRITFTHVPREFNRLADAAVNRALDEAAAERGHAT